MTRLYILVSQSEEHSSSRYRNPQPPFLCASLLNHHFFKLWFDDTNLTSSPYHGFDNTCHRQPCHHLLRHSFLVVVSNLDISLNVFSALFLVFALLAGSHCCHAIAVWCGQVYERKPLSWGRTSDWDLILTGTCQIYDTVKGHAACSWSWWCCHHWDGELSVVHSVHGIWEGQARPEPIKSSATLPPNPGALASWVVEELLAWPQSDSDLVLLE